MMNALSSTSIISYSLEVSTISYILSFAVIFYVFAYKWRRRKVLKMLDAFYSKPTLPFIGNLHYVTGNAKERVIKMLNLMKEGEFPAVGWIFHIPVVLIGTPADMQTVLQKTYERDTLGMFKNVFGEGIIFSNGEKWRKSRRIINPAFSVAMLQQYLIVFNEHSKVLLKKIHPLANTDKAFDVWSYMINFNLDVITQNMTDHKLQLQEKGENEFTNSLMELAKMESMRYTQPLLFPNFIYNIYLFLTGKGKIFEKVHELPRQIIAAKIADYNSKKKEQSENTEETGKCAKTLIDLLLKAHDSDADFTEEQIRFELLNMIFAGSDTSSLTSSFLLLMLAMNQDVQEKVYLEINTVFGDSDRPVEIDDMNKLVYLEQCIKETLRKFPVIPLTFRKHSEDIQLNNKQVIPAGCLVGAAYLGVHHNEQLYPNPERWDPEHFAPETIRDHKAAFLAFGIGPRACIGAKYGMISLKTQLVYLLRNYRFTTDMKMDDIELIVDITLRNDTGYWLKMWSRDNNNV